MPSNGAKGLRPFLQERAKVEEVDDFAAEGYSSIASDALRVHIPGELEQSTFSLEFPFVSVSTRPLCSSLRLFS